MSSLTSAIARIGALALVGCLHAYWFLQPVPPTFQAAVALLVILSILRPAFGLFAFAALAPVSTVFAHFCGAPGLGRAAPGTNGARDRCWRAHPATL